MAKLIVVGGGLFGRIAADLAHAQGHAVTVIDRHEEEAGSPAAGCLFKPSWMANVAWYDDAIDVLDTLYDVQTLQFKVRGTPRKVAIQHVTPGLILRGPSTTPYELLSGNVVKVTSTGVTFTQGNKRRTMQGWVYVATGVWAKELIPMCSLEQIKARKGMSLLIPTTVKQPKLDPWAPYKQSLLFNLKPGVAWFGDGSVIKPENWTEARETATLKRANKLARLPSSQMLKARRVRGLRPMAGKEGIFQHFEGRTYVGTGGGKMGTLLGVRFAQRLMDEMN